MRAEYLTVATVFMQVSRLSATAKPSLCQEPWPLAQRVVEAGERVVDVPAKLAARVRLFDTGHNRKTDALDAHSIAIVAVRTKRGSHNSGSHDPTRGLLPGRQSAPCCS